MAWRDVVPDRSLVIQQLREAFPFENASRFLRFDRGGCFNTAAVSTLRRWAFRSPWQNAVAERFVATVRHELLDHLIVLNDRHLRLLLAEFVAYSQTDRTHLALDKDAPAGRPVELRPCATSSVVAFPRVGGLHRRYTWCRAAYLAGHDRETSTLAQCSEASPRDGRVAGRSSRRGQDREFLSAPD